MRLEDIYQALWTAVRQLNPQRIHSVPTLHGIGDEKVWAALERAHREGWPRLPTVSSPRRVARLLFASLGEPTLILTSIDLEAAGADATSRALEAAAENLGAEVLWEIPPGASSLEGVRRVTRPEGDGAGSSAANGACHLQQSKPPSAGPFQPTLAAGKPEAAVQVRYEPVLGRPHPASPGELALHAAIEGSPDLAGRARYNAPVPTRMGVTPIVDVVFGPEGLAVEVDGYAFHRSQAAFERDRQRDFALLASGHRVLRLPHDGVLCDPLAAVDKIRAVLATALEPIS
ncbi:MAG TPA: DUF559 domain-containing protein [Myxococcales bacterium LLY-WYZ-16_1]|nr:DUF559 domain-containing protein [Myxococcales bacterium LLY-WYZ-16_1]